MIVFLTDGEATSGVQSSSAILSNVRSANEELQVPIHSLAFGDNADFDLLKDISNENHGFAQRIYESGNSFEQIEDFFNGISDPKLKDVKFQYLYNGQRILPANLTSTHIDHAFGKNEYVIAGTFEQVDTVPDIKLLIEANHGDFQQELIIHPCLVPREGIIGESSIEGIHERRICFPSVFWNKTVNEEFLERLWAFKRIKYLFEDTDCERVLENTNQSCKEEATELALQYNFVTEVTSLVVEANGEYQNVEATEDPSNTQRRPVFAPAVASFQFSAGKLPPRRQFRPRIRPRPQSHIHALAAAPPRSPPRSRPTSRPRPESIILDSLGTSTTST